MSLVVFQGVGLHFGARAIIDELDLRIAEGDRIGLVGPNGSGKSSLLKLLCGELTPDAGTIGNRRDLRLGYLPQDLDLRDPTPLREFVRRSVPGRARLEEDRVHEEARLARASEAGDEDALMDAAAAVGELHERLADFERQYSDHEAARILAGLGFTQADRERPVAEFSGGWRMRAVLAGLLFQQPDLLLLDEPTNHLDLPSVAWLAAFLSRYRRAFVLICHDREFLNEQVRRIVSFEPEGVRQYPGDYEQYRRQRVEEEEVLRNKAKNVQREREQAERFITRFRAQASKARAVQSRVKALERMESVSLHGQRDVMAFRFPPCARSGDEVVKLRGVRKAYGNHVVFDGLDVLVRRGEKIGIIGPNGAGKTTLLRLMNGELPVDAGTVRLGHNVTLGTYAQHHTEALGMQRTILEEAALADPGAGQTRLRAVLGAFLFGEEEVDKRIAVLSGGEKARVALAKLLLAPGNLLLMDEPTNHLDLESSEKLATALAGFDGTLLFVSHNRSFIRKLATRIWDVHDGNVEVYPGTLDEYMARYAQRGDEDESSAAAPRATKATAPSRPAAAAASATSARPAASPLAGAAAPRPDDRARRREEAQRRHDAARRVAPLKRRVAALEAEIASVEAEQKARSLALADPEVWQDADRRAQTLEAYRKGAARLEEVTAAWEAAQQELESTEAAGATS